MAKAEKKTAIERDYEVILGPVVTEKSTMGSQYGQVTFKVRLDSTKPEIKRAVETLWGVDVKKVNTILTKGKTKRFRGVMGKRSDYKKAIVTLKEGQTIDLGASF